MSQSLGERAATYPAELRAFFDGAWDFDDISGEQMLRDHGITDALIPELERMVCDLELYNAPASTQFWQGPYLACHALGALRAVDSVSAILRAVDAYDDAFEFWYEDLPKILEPMGARLLPILHARLSDPSSNHTSCQVCADILERVGLQSPANRAECVDILTRFLQQHRDRSHTDHWANASAVDSLVELDAVESESAIEAAFAAGVVDEFATGDWSDVREDLHLGAEGRVEKLRQMQKRALGRRPSTKRRRADPAKLAKVQARKRRASRSNMR